MALEKKQATEFYLKTTNVLDTGVDLPLVTLPAGTVLFRGQRLPNPANVDPRVFYSDFLGNPEGSQHVCLNPTHNTFFYPLPYVAFGINDVGKTYDIMNIVVLVHPITVVSMISPSRFVRGTVKRFSGKSPIQRCSTLTTGLCHEPSAKEVEALQYDNCLNPEYQMRSSTRGWMAIAELDALTSRGGAGSSSMASYVKALESRKPGQGVELVAHSYTDLNRTNGFPEIALYPYRVHKGLKALKRPCKDIKTAIHLMQKEAEADNLNYLPIASITREGTIDMINGLFTYERLGVSANAFTTPALNKQPDIEGRLAEYMDLLQSKGLNLPFYGKGNLSFDTRTGFYVFPQVIPRMQITEKGETFPYRYLAMPLSTEDERRRAITYMLMFRSMNDDKFMQKYGLEKGFGVKRAMIFDRPPVLTNLFRDLGLPIPALFRDGLGRASRIHKENTATAAAPAPSAPSGATAALPAPRTAASPAPRTAAPPAAQPRTPPLPPTPALPKGIVAARQSMREGMTVNDIIGGYGKPINPFGLSVEEQGELVKESQASTTPPGAPDSPPYRPSTPLRGGTRSKKVVKRGTRRIKTVEHLAKAFSKVWAKLGKK